MNLSPIQSKFLSELSDGRMLDKTLAVRLHSTLHGTRSAGIALLRKGLVNRYRTVDGDSWEYEAKFGNDAATT